MEQIFNYYKRDVFVSRDAIHMSEEFEAAVGMSRKWDAREAGREVARSTLSQLSHPPKFFLLFSTIHYEKHGGFQEFLNGVWDVLPEGTPLVGGTVAGFINPQGCYTRGCSAIAGYYPNMDVAVGLGKNTKRNPINAARDCAEMLKGELNESHYEHKFILDIVSSGLVPQIPGMGRTMVIPSKITGKVALKMLNYSGKVLQKGVCRQDEVLKEFIKILPDYSLVHGGATDDITQIRNYQFFEKNVSTNSICALALNIDSPIFVKTTHGLIETDRTFKVTSLDKTKRVIKTLDGKPAIPRLFELLHLKMEDLNENIFKKIFFLPIGFRTKEGRLLPTVVGIFLGDYFYVIFQIENENGTVLNLSGKGLLNSINENLTIVNENTKMGLISSCASRLLALGNHVYDVHKKLKEKFEERPFLLYYAAGEGSYSKETGLEYGNYTFNSAIFN